MHRRALLKSPDYQGIVQQVLHRFLHIHHTFPSPWQDWHNSFYTICFYYPEFLL